MKKSDPSRTHSRLRERIVEHTFVAEALRWLWRQGVVDVEVFRSEFDTHGYDVAMARGPIVRHIQLKTGMTQTPGDVSVALALANKPSGCVLWIRVTKALDMGPFFWFGSTPGKRLPRIKHYRVPKRATHNKEGVRPPRKNHRLVPKTAFTTLCTIDDVLAKLFGKVRA